MSRSAIRSTLNQHDPVWEMMPAEWLDGIPLGNGRAGVVWWGRNERELVGSLDRSDIWELRNPVITDARYTFATLRDLMARKAHEEIFKIFEQAEPRRKSPFGWKTPHVTRMPLPRLVIKWPEAVSEFEARLNLYDAVVAGHLRCRSGSTPWRTWVESGEDVIIMMFEKSKDMPAPSVFIDDTHFDEKINHYGETTIREIMRTWEYPAPVREETDGLSFYGQVFPCDGGYAVGVRKIETEQQWFYVAAVVQGRTMEELKDRVKENMKRFDSRTDGGDPMGSRRDWHAYWGRSDLQIPDGPMEALYYLELYKMRCNMRPDAMPCALQGVWTRGSGGMPPWRGEYAANVNVQQTYWPIYASNHLDLGKPLYDQQMRNLPGYEHRCRALFGVEGAQCTSGQGPNGEPVWGLDFWPGTGPWLAHMFWLHWRYSGDKKFLRARAYPFMRAFMQAYLNLLEKGPDGKWHLPLSYSPEYGDGALTGWGRDTACDLALIRWLGNALVQTVEILGINDSVADQCRQMLPELTDYPADEGEGLHIYEGQPLACSHRHPSHLIGIYPLGVLSVDGSENDRRLIQASWQHWIFRGTSEWVGWAYPFAACIAFRLRDRFARHIGWRWLQAYFDYIRPNTMHINVMARKYAPQMKREAMTLEGGFGYVAAVLEMLLQSWGGVIRVFPAIPDFWSDASFRSLRAEGAFLVTARMENRRVLFVEIESELENECRLENPFEGAAKLVCLDDGQEKKMTGGQLAFPARRGGRYRLTPAEGLTDENVKNKRIRHHEENNHLFGLKKTPRF